MKPFSPIYLIVIAISFCSCQSGQITETLLQADRLVENDPDSALTLLSSYLYPETLDQADFAAYQLMYTKAKDKCYMDLSGDTTVILKSLTYYKEHGNASQKGWSNYYAGRVFEEAGKLFEAGIYFLKAAEYAGEIPDALLGMMANYYLGMLHDKQYAFDKSLDSYKKSYDIYCKTNEKKYTGLLLHTLGSEYGINAKMDSAFYFLRKSLDVAIECQDTMAIAAIYNDLGLYLKEDGQFLKAKEYLLRSLAIEDDSCWMIIRKITLADIYTYLNRKDSTILLLNEVRPAIEASKDIELHAIYYSALAKMEASNKNYKEAFLNQKQYVTCVDSVYQLHRKNSLAETERIYNYIKYQEENGKLREIQHNTVVFCVVVLGVLFILFIIIVWLKWKRRQDLSNAEETVDALRKMEKENQNKYNNEIGEQVTFLACSDEEKDNMVKKALLMQLNITKVLSQLDEKSDKDQSFLVKFNNLFYGEQRKNDVNWEDFYVLVNLLYDGFAQKLQVTYADILNEREMQLCCLLKVNMDTTEIACIMKQRINTVRTRKTTIRKKLNAPDAADIVAFLEGKLISKS